MTEEKKTYPDWICWDCGNKYGEKKFILFTWNEDICGWCEKKTGVTEPKDFSYPKWKEKTK